MSGKRRHEEEEHENEERWLLTYADLITLLMVFFVVMYSMAQTDAAKFAQMATSLRAAFNNPLSTPLAMPTGGGGRNGEEITTKNLGSKTVVDGQKIKMKKLEQQFKGLVAKEGLGDLVHVDLKNGGKELVLRLADSLLFSPGSADLTADSLALIDKIVDVIYKTKANVRVEGHTDNIPISSGKYRNNWELSTARAVNVVEHVLTKPELSMSMTTRMSASGYAEYHPIEPNDSPENRAKNRRVEFVITDEALSSADMPFAEGEVTEGEKAEQTAPVADGSASVPPAASVEGEVSHVAPSVEGAAPAAPIQ